MSIRDEVKSNTKALRELMEGNIIAMEKQKRMLILLEADEEITSMLEHYQPKLFTEEFNNKLELMIEIQEKLHDALIT